MTDSIMQLSTQVKPAQQFEVDGETYDLLGLEHLSPEDEARATAGFTRFAQILNRLEEAPNDEQAKKYAGALRKRRIELIVLLTTIPTEVADKLPISAQAKLFTAIQRETGQEDERGDELRDEEL